MFERELVSLFGPPAAQQCSCPSFEPMTMNIDRVTTDSAGRVVATVTEHVDVWFCESCNATWWGPFIAGEI